MNEINFPDELPGFRITAVEPSIPVQPTKDKFNKDEPQIDANKTKSLKESKKEIIKKCRYCHFFKQNAHQKLTYSSEGFCINERYINFLNTEISENIETSTEINGNNAINVLDNSSCEYFHENFDFQI